MDSDVEAVGAIARTEIRITKNGEGVVADVMGDKALTQLQSMQATSYSSQTNLDSDTTYDVEFVCYDRYYNKIVLENYKIQTKTCKEMLKITLKITNQKDSEGENIINALDVSTEMTNPDNVAYTELKLQIFDEEGNPVLINGRESTLINAFSTTPVVGLKTASKYTAVVSCIADNGDGKGMITRTLASKQFSTYAIDALGDLVLTAKNVTKTEFPDDAYKRAVIDVSVNNNTKKQLLLYVDTLKITLKCDSDVITYSLNQEELEKLKNNETVRLDTDNPAFSLNGLKGNKKYSVSFEATNITEVENKKIPVKSSLGVIETARTPVNISVKNFEAVTGYIGMDVSISDVDEVIVGETAILKIYEANESGNTLFASFRLDKNGIKDENGNVIRDEEGNMLDYQIRMFKDSTYSFDGKSYDVKGGKDYIFEFVAEEANTIKGREYDYCLKRETRTAKATVEGNVYLKELIPVKTIYRNLPSEYTQLEYIKSTGKQYIIIPHRHDENTWMDMDLSFDLSYPGYNTMIGAATKDNASDSMTLGTHQDGRINNDLGKGIQKSGNYYKSNQRYNIVWNFYKEIINGVEYDMPSPIPNSTIYYTEIFGRNLKNTKTSEIGKGAFYRLRIYRGEFQNTANSVLEFDLVPARRNSDGELGLYDVVNGVFYTNDYPGGDNFIAGEEVLPADDDFNPLKQLKATMVIEVADLKASEEDASVKKVYLDIYKDNKFIETLEFPYIGQGTGEDPINFDYIVDKSPEDKPNTYYFELYTYYGTSQNPIKIPLNNASFTTEKSINTISNMDEFIAIKDKVGKYVVVADLEYESEHVANTKGPFGTNSFNAQVDFQGFSLKYTGYSSLLYKISETGKISNLVFIDNAKVRKNTTLSAGGNNNNSSGSLVTYNYGTIENIFVEFSQIFPDEPDNNISFDNASWKDKDGVQYAYPNNTALAYDNYGTIENFVIKVKTDVHLGGVSAIVVAYNRALGTIRNGYVYNNNEQIENKVQFFAHDTSTTNAGLEINGIVNAYNIGGIIENIYVLGDIYNKYDKDYEYIAIVCGRNEGSIRNAFTYGNVSRADFSYEAYGPLMGKTTTGIRRNYNNFYISNLTYSNTRNTQASSISLRNINWMNSLLNAETTQFNVDELVKGGSYPQLIYTSNNMPSQDFIPLPAIPKKSEIDLLFSSVYNRGENEDIDERLANFFVNIGDEIWVDESNNQYSNNQILLAQVSNKLGDPIYGIETSDGLDARVLLQINDGRGISTLYLLISKPNKAYNKYVADSIIFEDAFGNAGEKYGLEGRYLNVGYFRCISKISSDNMDSWTYVQSNIKESYRLKNDLDFNGKTVESIYVPGTFTGQIDAKGPDGNNYTIKNLTLKSGDFENVLDDVDYRFTGIFESFSGNLTNINFDNISIEGGVFSGVVSGIGKDCYINNVFITNSYSAGVTQVGVLFGHLEASDIKNVGIINSKAIMIGGISLKNSSNKEDIYQNNNNDHLSGVGPIAGYARDITVSRIFGSENYIESFAAAHSTSAAGGLIGFTHDSITIDGAYSTGWINSGTVATGGLIGSTSSSTRISNAYSDVDIVTYGTYAGGVVGSVGSTITGNTLLSFGNVSTGKILSADPDATDNNSNRYSLISYNYNNSKLNARYYNNAKLTVSGFTKTSNGNSFPGSIISSNVLYSYLSSSIFAVDTNASHGVLPKMIYEDGSIMPFQNDVYIDENGGSDEIRINSITQSGNTIKVDITHVDSITIDKVSLDNTIFNLIGVDASEEGVNSLLKKNVFTTSVSKLTSPNSTVLTVNINSINCSYDKYFINGISYKKDNNYHILRVGNILDIGQRFTEIANVGDWNSKVSGTIAENFIIKGDIDFRNDNLSYCDEGVANLVINRLIGDKGNVSDYMNMADDSGQSNPYYSIKNIKMLNYSEYNSKFGRIYNSSNGFIRNILSEISKISFDNIEIKKYGSAGVIAYNSGKINGVIFNNCSISNTGTNVNTYGLGLIGVVQNSIENVYVNNYTFKSNVIASGVIGSFNTNIYGVSANNIYIENVNGTSRERSAILIGYSFSDYVVDSSRKPVQNITINNSKLVASSHYNGGIVGLSYGYIDITNANVGNSVIQGNYYNGGLIGNLSTNSVTLSSNYIYNTKITSTGQYAGGLVGTGGGRYRNCVVDSSTVVARTGYAGGASGYQSRSLSSNDDGKHLSTSDMIEDKYGYSVYITNTRVYTTTYAGGLAGRLTTTAENVIVKNCEIKANSYVGGLTGNYSSDAGHVNYSYVADTVITHWKDSDETRKYLIKFDSNHEYFGGVSGSYTSAYDTLIENCFIGGEEANYVGGLSGKIDTKTKYPIANSSAENCVVYGKSYVGSLFGKMMITNKDYASNAINCYSNALVYGQSRVAGLVGSVSDFEYAKNSFSTMPLLENCYFTGTIMSENDVSALFGEVVLNRQKISSDVDNTLFMRNVSSMPYLIKANTIYPLFNYNGSDNVYNLSNLARDTSNLMVSLYADTKVITSGNVSTMAVLLENNEYKKYVKKTADITIDNVTIDEVKNNYSKNIAGDSFIILYKDYNDIIKYFDDYSTVKGSVSSKLTMGTVDYLYGFVDIENDELMPLYYSASKANPSASDVCFQNLTYKALKNVFTGNIDKIMNVNQGVAVPGSQDWNDEILANESMFNSYVSGGISNLPIGIIESEVVDNVGYTQISFIRSTGSQYIVIPHRHEPTTWVDMEVSFNRVNYSNTIYGAETKDNSNDSFTIGTSNYGRINNDLGKSVNLLGPYFEAERKYDIKISFSKEIIKDLENNQTIEVDFTNPKPNTSNYDTSIFIKNISNTFTSEKGEATIYGLKIYAGELDNVSESTLLFDLVPARRNSDGALGLFDKVGRVFYENSGTGEFIAGEPVGNEILYSNDAIDKLVMAYSSGVDKLNIEIKHDFYKLNAEEATLKVINKNNSSVLYSGNIINTNFYENDGSVLTFNYDYNTPISINLSYKKYNQIFTLTRDIYPSDVYSAVSLTSSNGVHNAYALVGGKIYDQSGSSTNNSKFVNLYGNKVLDEDGKIYIISASNGIVLNYYGNVSSTINKTDTRALYEFTYDGRDIKTYGSKSVIVSGGNLNISKDYRLFVKGSNITAIMENSNSVADPIYAQYDGDTRTVLMLNGDGKVYSIGTKDILTSLSSFNNSGIKQISSNISGDISASNPYLLFSYKNGTVVGYNIITKAKINFGPTASGTSLPSYLLNSFSTMFSLNSVEGNYSSYSLRSSNVASVLTANNVTLDSLIDFMSGSEENTKETISAINEGNGVVIDNLMHSISDTNEEYDNNQGYLEPSEENAGTQIHHISSKEENINVIDKPIISENGQIVVDNTDLLEVPRFEGLEDVLINTSKTETNQGLITDNSLNEKKTEYISVFNGETEEFEIYSVDELLENPSEVSSQENRVVDKATLKALYSSLAQQEDKTNERGIMLYLVVAAFTLVLLISIVLLLINSKNNATRMIRK